MEMDLSPSASLGATCNIEHIAALPDVQRVPHPKIEMFIMRDFLSADECAPLIELIESHRQPSTLVDPNGDGNFRTSETCHMPLDISVVAALDKKLSAFSGIAPEYGEWLQGQRYEVGQEFKAHTDYFEPNGAGFYEHTAKGGQRTWTFMIYLNTPEAGGATQFKAVKKTVQPETGKLVFWNNRRPDGSCNPSTIHHAMKVRKGRKYVITKWYRELPWG